MEVLKLMNSNPNWRDVLCADPYNITIKEDGDYVLLKYSQINSDFNLPIVRECRGAIFFYDGEQWYCVRRAFDKFGNYGEGYAAEIDWNTAVVQEKIDGSLMSLWFHNGTWHLSTNGTIDAFKAPLGDTGLTFGDYFIECLNCDYEDFLKVISEKFCYTFEMVGPMNRVIIPYNEAKLYAIGMRDMVTMKEYSYLGPLGKAYNIWLPRLYPLGSLDEVIAVAEKLSKDEEGFVVRDQYFNRIKVKSPEYLMAARLHNNGVITKKRMMEIVLTEKVDDFIAYCPMYESAIRDLESQVVRVCYKILFERVKANQFLSLPRADYAKAIKDFKYKHYLFGVYDGKYDMVYDYVFSLRPEQALNLIETL